MADGDFDTTAPVPASEPDSFDFKQTSGSKAFHVTLEQGAGGKYYVTSATVT